MKGGRGDVVVGEEEGERVEEGGGELEMREGEGGGLRKREVIWIRRGGRREEERVRLGVGGGEREIRGRREEERKMDGGGEGSIVSLSLLVRFEQ